MAISVVMPALELAQERGTLVSWMKKEGERVTKGEMLLAVETDKAVVEVEAAGDGILAGVTAVPGDVIPVGRVIGWLVQPGEMPPSAVADAPVSRQTNPAPVGLGQSRPAQPGPAHAGSVAAGLGAVTPTSDRSRLRISPKARRLAEEHGVDLALVAGSGPAGEIGADDILAAVRNRNSRGSETAPSSGPGTVPHTNVGRLMAERTTGSWTSVPHFFLRRDVDATALTTARERLSVEVERSHGVRLTYTDLILSAVARALVAHPRLNASWSDAGIVTHPDVNLGFAIAVENAVVMAVIAAVDTLTPGEIAVRRRDLTERARAGRLRPSDIAGATFTVSNLGAYEVDAFTAIIVPPQAGILAVGAIADRVVALDGNAVVRPMMTVTLSCDHRVVDGARGAAFLRDAVRHLTAPHAAT